MKTFRVAAVAVFLAVLVAVGSGFAKAPAAPAPVPSSCYMVVDKLKPGQLASDVVSKGCTANGARPSATQDRAAAADTSVVIAKF